MELAYNRRQAERTFVQVEKVNTPLMRVGIVHSKRLPFDVEMLFRIIDLELLKVGIRIQKLLVIGDAVVIDPIIRANKAVRKPAHVSPPVAD
jgi:hypothetical protein